MVVGKVERGEPGGQAQGPSPPLLPVLPSCFLFPSEVTGGPSGMARMRQQEGRDGGGVRQSAPRDGASWCQHTPAAAWGRGGVSLCAQRGQSASCEASCGQRTEGWALCPSPASLFPAWPCPDAPPPPSLAGALASRLGSPGSRGPPLCSPGRDPPRTLAPIWLPHWPACRCTISRMMVVRWWTRRRWRGRWEQRRLWRG